MSSDKIIYRTDNLALCPYLAIHGLTYIKAEMTDSGKIFFLFDDPENKAKSLTMAFASSPERRYKTYWQIFRNEIDEERKKWRKRSGAATNYKDNEDDGEED